MAINRDLGDLPKAEARPGRPPSRKPIVVNALADEWFRRYQESDAENKPHAIEGRKFRLSSVAHRCDREMFFGMTREPKSNPPSVADAWRMGIGTMVHHDLQEVVEAMGTDGWRSEIVVDLREIGIDGSGSLDLVRFVDNRTGEPMTCTDRLTFSPDGDADAVEHFQYAAGDGTPTKWLRKGEWDRDVEKPVMVCELKTVGGFKFKMSAAGFKGPPQGPMTAHVMQPALGAIVLNVDQIIVGYLSLENISPDIAARLGVADETGRFTAEWHLSVAALMESMITPEVLRINRVGKLTDAGIVPARELHDPEVPAGAIVDDPAHSGRWSVRVGDKISEVGTWWGCAYCGWRDRCVQIGAGNNDDDEAAF